MNAETNILSMTDLQHTALISGNKAMQLLELSRHSFEKVVKESKLAIGTPSTNQQMHTDRPPLNCRD